MIKVTAPKKFNESAKIMPWGFTFMGLAMISLIFLPHKPNQCYDKEKRFFNKTAQGLVLYGICTIGFGLALRRFNKKIGTISITMEQDKIEYFWLENTSNLLSIPKFKRRSLNYSDVEYYKVMKWYGRLEIGFKSNRKISIDPRCENRDALLNELKNRIPTKEVL